MTYAVPIRFDVPPEVQTMLTDAVTLAELTRERIAASNSRLSHTSNLVMTTGINSKLKLLNKLEFPNPDRATIELYALDRFDIREQHVSDELIALVMFYSEYLYRLHGDHQLHCFYANGRFVKKGDIPLRTQIESLRHVLEGKESRVFKFYLQERAYLNLELERDAGEPGMLNVAITVRDSAKWREYLQHVRGKKRNTQDNGGNNNNSDVEQQEEAPPQHENDVN
eukprot:3363265-Rhodomonas_salina.2